MSCLTERVHLSSDWTLRGTPPLIVASRDSASDSRPAPLGPFFAQTTFLACLKAPRLYLVVLSAAETHTLKSDLS